MSLLTVSAAEVTAESCKDYFYVDLGNNEYTCTNLTSDILTKAKEGQTPVVKLTKDLTVNVANIVLNRDIVYDLNGHTMTIGTTYGYKIEGANVTFKNGTLVVKADKSGYVFEVNSATKASTLTLDVKVESKDGHPFIKVTDATEKTEININNTWEVAHELVDCDNGKDKKLTVNLNATINEEDLTRPLVTLDAGESVVNVIGGSYTTKKNVFEVTNGTLNVKAGTIKSVEGNAVKVNTPTGSYKNALSITGGNLVSEETYSVEFATIADSKTGKYAISNGEFTSGEDKDGNRLPALHTTAWNFLDNHKNMITGGKFAGSVIGDVMIGDKVYKTAAAAQAILVGNATVKRC